MSYSVIVVFALTFVSGTQWLQHRGSVGVVVAGEMKVLDDDGKGLASNLIAAIEYIQELNGNGRRIRVHGVNMSVGIPKRQSDKPPGPKDDLDKLLRYEAMINRQLNHAISELERLQARRKGGPTAA